jgi:hypothetical protein
MFDFVCFNLQITRLRKVIHGPFVEVPLKEFFVLIPLLLYKINGVRMVMILGISEPDIQCLISFFALNVSRLAEIILVYCHIMAKYGSR